MKQKSKQFAKEKGFARLIDSRPNKTAKGIAYTLERQKHTSKNRASFGGGDVTTLHVRGTVDKLKHRFMEFRQIEIPHPTDLGYFKRAFVLTDRGKLTLKYKRQELNIATQKKLNR